MDHQPVVYQREVYYYETDRMGIVHHSNYIRWMEEARIDYLRQIGLPYDRMEAQGILIPVLSVQTEYKKAFRYGDSFSIGLLLEGFTGLKFTITYRIYHTETKELHATGRSGHGFVDEQLLPIRMKRDYPDIYERLRKHVGAESTFVTAQAGLAGCEATGSRI